MDIDSGILSRARLLVGDETMTRVENARVIVFGVGGVGSWCVESLVRSGVRRITIVDNDKVCVSNINRQRMATVETIGRNKVEALKDILLTILPDVQVRTLCMSYCEETADSFHLDDYDYIVDAIDSLKDKALLIENACHTKAKLFSSMGAALKMDPTRIKVAEFWKVSGCPLARALRQRFKKTQVFPSKKFLCVYSDELLENIGEQYEDSNIRYGEIGAVSPLNGVHDTRKARINGSLMHITAIYGMMLAGLILKDLNHR